MAKKTQTTKHVLERRSFPKGHLIIRQGESGNIAYLIQSGKVRVYASAENERVVDLATMDAGQIFGEMALIFDEPRSANVEALTDVTAIIITRKVLDEKLVKSDPTVRAIIPMLVRRIVQANNRMLSRFDSVDDIIDMVYLLYDNLQDGLEPVKKKTLENTVLPELESFVKAARAFDERYKKDEN